MRLAQLTAAAVLAATAAAAADVAFQPDALPGEYTLTAMVKDGDKADKVDGRVTVTKDKITAKMTSPDGSGMDYEFAYKLDPKASPAQIDMEILAPEAFKGAKAKGIVALDATTFKLAYHPADADQRPKDFDAKKGTGEYSLTMTKAPTGEKPAKGDK